MTSSVRALMGADRPEDGVADRQLMSMFEVFIEANVTFILI